MKQRQAPELHLAACAAWSRLGAGERLFYASAAFVEQ